MDLLVDTGSIAAHHVCKRTVKVIHRGDLARVLAGSYAKQQRHGNNHVQHLVFVPYTKRKVDKKSCRSGGCRRFRCCQWSACRKRKRLVLRRARVRRAAHADALIYLLYIIKKRIKNIFRRRLIAIQNKHGLPRPNCLTGDRCVSIYEVASLAFSPHLPDVLDLYLLNFK